MALHLNWDGKQNNGIIFNGTYNGAMFKGAELKPALSFEYESFLYTEVFQGQPNYVIQTNGAKRLMTATEETEVAQKATDWVQPLGQEGNPTLAQAKEIAKGNVRTGYFNELKTVPVNHNGIDWDCDEDSPMKLDGELRYQQKLGSAVAVFYDANNTAHELSIADADAVVMAVTAEFRNRLGKKQYLFNQIDGVFDDGSNDPADISSVLATAW